YGYDVESKIGNGYSQSISSYQHTHFIRIYEENKHVTNILWIGLRRDTIKFTNTSPYLDEYQQLQYFDVDARLVRHAFRTGYAKQYIIGRKPYRRGLGLAGGVFYEGSLKMERIGSDRTYTLYSEQLRHNIGLQLKAELKFRWFCIGYKYEKLLFDMLNREKIKDTPVQPNNASELRGLNLSPEMSFVYFGLYIPL
ncbi:MAG: hypothetical protein MI922_17575, partial [Bacteroidales bacterium]|nr:hypothetical protein [Bacteroidales bacterium]